MPKNAVMEERGEKEELNKELQTAFKKHQQLENECKHKEKRYTDLYKEYMELHDSLIREKSYAKGEVSAFRKQFPEAYAAQD